MKYEYKGALIKRSGLKGIRGAVPDYEAMLITILDAILQRFESDPAYPFINTKLNTITGEDFPTPKDDSTDIRGKTAVYGWIQGRGLEALVGHIRWLPSCSILSQKEKQERIERLTKMVEIVFRRTEEIRARNNGLFTFLMTPDGQPFAMDENGRRRPYNAGGSTTVTDLFYSKGMLAAASLLGNKDKVEEARSYFRTIVTDITSDRQPPNRMSFEPKKPAPPAGKRSHGARMVSIAGFALFAQELGDDEWFEGGQAFIRYILDHHINMGKFKGLQPFDFFESIGPDNQPWMEQERVLSDPGHSLEFVGLAAKFLRLMSHRRALTRSQQALLERCIELFPNVLLRNYRNGRNEKVGGICKAFDLISRKPINSDMPWWNLPETLRSAAELLVMCPDDKIKGDIMQVITDCSNAFMKNFVNPKAHLMAYQTLDASGRPVDVIPATSDADPGYHTGLSIIDFLECVNEL